MFVCYTCLYVLYMFICYIDCGGLISQNGELLRWGHWAIHTEMQLPERNISKAPVLWDPGSS